jgi:DMSO/TMAO reductase YedYZ heme-binding membrane subunit
MPKKNVVKKSPAPASSSDWIRYVKTALFGAVVFGLCYSYIRWTGAPNELNKSLADTSILLISFSMVISSLCYFWNTLDWTIVYRKHLGILGFAFGVAHLSQSWGAFMSLLDATTWQQGKMWPVLMGALALGLFAAMAIISNTVAALLLGGKIWRYILRSGYLAIIFVWLHVVLLKSARWILWYEGGMKTPPSLSLIVTGVMSVVLLARVVLWWRLRRAKN